MASNFLSLLSLFFWTWRGFYLFIFSIWQELMIMGDDARNLDSWRLKIYKRHLFKTELRWSIFRFLLLDLWVRCPLYCRVVWFLCDEKLMSTASNSSSNILFRAWYSSDICICIMYKEHWFSAWLLDRLSLRQNQVWWHPAELWGVPGEKSKGGGSEKNEARRTKREGGE